ncbi:hypothetical protein [Rhizobium sp. BR 362]|uniref:hypothetical protein n=1 Tax=Rhizobium sp. BR 362 TaxID=3040670 RepID=UPI002F3E5EB4
MKHVPANFVTEAKAAKANEEIIDAFRGLDHDISCLRNMARILADLLDDSLFDRSVDAGSAVLTIKLTDSEMEMLSFAWNDVASRASRLQVAFDAAARGECLQ